MNSQDASNIVSEYLKPVFGFAVKRCRSVQDAEDLTQEIMLRTFRSLTVREDISDVPGFIWTVAHNALCNYYRDAAKNAVGVSLDEIEHLIASPDMSAGQDESDELIRQIRKEIAYLSVLQRKIVVAYYFEGRKQNDPAEKLGIPLGTVKWHLFEAKKSLKRGMETMRNASRLTFDPIKFHSFGINGSVGTKSPDEFFRSALPQNICYCVRNEAKTVNEIAESLGVSPVYVESEVTALSEYGLLRQQGNKYIVNFIISEPTSELLRIQDNMYKRAAELFANDLYDELTVSGVLDDPDIICSQTDEPLTMTGGHQKERNFILWSLIPYIAARSGEKLFDRCIAFEEVATIRPDGGNNIVHASVVPDDLTLPEDYVYMHNWCGPMWNSDGSRILWQIDSEWSEKRCRGVLYQEEAARVLSLFDREDEGPLSKDEYAWLSERGYIKTVGDYDGCFKSAWQVVILSGSINEKLLMIGEKIKLKHLKELESLKSAYVEAAVRSVPEHMRKVKEYELQYMFNSDGWFLLHCIVCLLKNGKLKEPTPGQRKSLTTLIIEQ